MQFRDLKTQYNVLKDEMDKAILNVVASSAYVMGPKIKEMETAFATILRQAVPLYEKVMK